MSHSPEQGDVWRRERMRRSDTPSFDELRQLLRLQGELRELPRGSEAQRRHLLERLCALVGAQVGIWVSISGIDSGRVAFLDALDTGWEGAREREVFWRFCRAKSDLNDDPSMRPLAEKTQTFATVTRDQLVNDRVWYSAAHVQEERRAARVDSFIYATVRLSASDARCISLHRPWGAPAFVERERRLIDVFQREARFLHQAQAGIPETVLCELAPRLQDTLRALARGASEKQVAAELRLSPHTVHEYVKALYRHFGVSSRGELLAHCFKHGI